MSFTRAIILGIALLVAAGTALFGGALSDAPPLRIGDVLRLNFPGEDAFNKDFQIDRAGSVELPEIGIMPIEGKPIPEATRLIREALARVYKNVDRLDISVKTRKLPITVLGYVKKPGPIELPSDANVQTALTEAGGLAQGAQLDKLQVRRKSKVLEFDYKKYLDSGDVAILPRLEPLDVVFVPASPLLGRVQTDKVDAVEKVGSTYAVQVFGAVAKPGRFEWSDGMTLFDILAHAGGPNARADTAHIKILKQADDHAQAVMFDLASFLSRGGSMNAVPKILAGYVVIVPELPLNPTDTKVNWVQQAPEQSIYVMGMVGVPGRYAFNNSMHFIDIIAAANGPTSTADLRNVRVSHRNARGSRVSKVDLARYFETGDDRLLPRVRPGDVIFVPDRNREWLDNSKESTIRVLGAVAKPGRYRFSDEMTLLDLLAEAGGPTRDAYQEKIIVVNMGCCSEQARAFNLVEFARTGDVARIPAIRAGDTVYIPDINQSDWYKISNALRDVVPIATVFALMRAF
jgi:protein involved in polysaccharide export with SLBB domain